MFEIEMGDDGVIILAGRLDTAESPKAQAFLDSVPEPRVLDFSRLNYISSAGLAVLLKTQKQLMQKGNAGLKLVGVNRHIADIFRFSGFDRIFEIEASNA